MLNSQSSLSKWGATAGCRSVLVILSLSLLASCSGSGESESESESDPPQFETPGSAGTDPYPSVNLNGSLAGRAFETGNASYFDLDTGEKVQLAGDSAYPSRDGSEVVEVHVSHRFLPDSGCYDVSVFNDLIIIRDALNGRVNDSFELAENVYGPVKLSPDGQTLAFF